jgi:hypothetical protein
MAPQIYTGSICFVMMRSVHDLSRYVPYPLAIADPERAFLKIYQLKRRPADGDPLAPSFSQYLQVCLCVLAAPPGQPLGHYNLMVWEMRDWTMAGEPHGARKKLATIETTLTFPTPDRYDCDEESDLYQSEVHDSGVSIIRLTAHLDGTGAEDPGVFGGFFRVRYLDDGDPRVGTASAEVGRIDVEDIYLGPAESGSGEVRIVPGIGYAPEEVAMLEAFGPGSIVVEGVTLRDVGWTRRTITAGTWVYPGPRSTSAARS